VFYFASDEKEKKISDGRSLAGIHCGRECDLLCKTRFRSVLMKVTVPSAFDFPCVRALRGYGADAAIVAKVAKTEDKNT
jgi:hypothetical protein